MQNMTEESMAGNDGRERKRAWQNVMKEERREYDLLCWKEKAFITGS